MDVQKWTQIHEGIFGKITASFFGACLGSLQAVSPLLAIFIISVFLDSLTAFRLARRVKRKRPDLGAEGKFESRKFGKVFSTMLIVCSLIWLCHVIQMEVFRGLDFALPNIIAGGAIFWQLWSILENESSYNEAGWARFLQRFLVDKTSRHIGIDLQTAIEGAKAPEKDAEGIDAPEEGGERPETPANG